MLDGVPENAPLLLAGVVCMTFAAWFAVRRNAAKSEAGRCRYCPRCGFDIAARMSGRGAMPQTRQVSTVVDAPRAAASEALPSDLLRGGWTRTVQPAADAAGRAVFSDSPDARYFTIWAAGNRAFDPGSRRWGSFFDAVRAVLRERYGNGVQIQKWNRVAVNQDAVVSVAQEAERRMRQHGEYERRSAASL